MIGEAWRRPAARACELWPVAVERGVRGEAALVEVVPGWAELLGRMLADSDFCRNSDKCEVWAEGHGDLKK